MSDNKTCRSHGPQTQKIKYVKAKRKLVHFFVGNLYFYSAKNKVCTEKRAKNTICTKRRAKNKICTGAHTITILENCQNFPLFPEK